MKPLARQEAASATRAGARDAEVQDADGERGSSLVDLLLGAAVMVTGLLGLMNLTAHAGRQRRLSAELALVHETCRSVIERVRATPLVDLPDFDGRTVPLPPQLRPISGSDVPPGRIAVALVGGDTERRLYRVSVSVDWAGVQAQTHFTCATLVGGW